MDHFAALRALRAIVDAGSFTAAAERLGTTHSAMSRQLRQLEEHLQVRLLDRNSRRLSLTEAGRDYHREAATLLDRLQEADDRARAGRELVAPLPLQQICTVDTGSLYLHQHLTRLQGRYRNLLEFQGCRVLFFSLDDGFHGLRHSFRA